MQKRIKNSPKPKSGLGHILQLVGKSYLLSPSTNSFMRFMPSLMFSIEQA